MPSRPRAQINLRIDAELRESLDRAATEHGVSLNRELGDRLRRSLEQERVPSGRNALARAILRIVEEAMNAAGESALFSQTHSWDVARQKDWTNDPYAYGQAVAAGIEVLKEFTPSGDQIMPLTTTLDARFWAEFFLKQAATGKGHVPETQPLAEALHAGLGNLADRISAFANINPGKNADARIAAKPSPTANAPRKQK
jgi:hypothetical protein